MLRHAMHCLLSRVSLVSSLVHSPCLSVLLVSSIRISVSCRLTTQTHANTVRRSTSASRLDRRDDARAEECGSDVCTKMSCLNGGQCVASSPDRGICLCPLGFGGVSCELRKSIPSSLAVSGPRAKFQEKGTREEDVGNSSRRIERTREKAKQIVELHSCLAICWSLLLINSDDSILFLSLSLLFCCSGFRVCSRPAHTHAYTHSLDPRDCDSHPWI